MTGYSTGANTALKATNTSKNDNSSRNVGRSHIIHLSKNETDISRLLRHRLECIGTEMNEFSNDVEKFSIDVDLGLSNLVNNMGLL